MRTIILLTTLLLLVNLPARAQDDGQSFVEEIQNAHGWESWPEGKLLQARVNVTFSGGLAPLKGKLIMTPDFATVRYEGEDGTLAIYDDGQAWGLEGAEMNGAHFMLPTVSYFIGAPFKLDDPGAHVEVLPEPLVMNGQKFPAAKITFGENVGDAPDDWYIAYKNPDTGILEGLAYIVTYFKPTEEAEKTPKIIIYGDYAPVPGSEVLISRDWKFYPWTQDQGPRGEVVYQEQVSETEWLDYDPGLFDLPEGAKNLTPETMRK